MATQNEKSPVMVPTIEQDVQVIYFTPLFRCAVKDIICVTYMRRKVVVYVDGREPQICDRTFEEVRDLLLAWDDFIQINRNYVVNLAMIEQVKDRSIHMKNGFTFPVSRQNKKMVEDRRIVFEQKVE